MLPSLLLYQNMDWWTTPRDSCRAPKKIEGGTPGRQQGVLSAYRKLG